MKRTTKYVAFDQGYQLHNTMTLLLKSLAPAAALGLLGCGHLVHEPNYLWYTQAVGPHTQDETISDVAVPNVHIGRPLHGLHNVSTPIVHMRPLRPRSLRCQMDPQPTSCIKLKVSNGWFAVWNAKRQIVDC